MNATNVVLLGATFWGSACVLVPPAEPNVPPAKNTEPVAVRSCALGKQLSVEETRERDVTWQRIEAAERVNECERPGLDV